MATDFTRYLFTPKSSIVDVWQGCNCSSVIVLFYNWNYCDINFFKSDKHKYKTSDCNSMLSFGDHVALLFRNTSKKIFNKELYEY